PARDQGVERRAPGRAHRREVSRPGDEGRPGGGRADPPAVPPVTITRRGATSPHIVGWLLVLPAAVLLVTFTHYPAVATLYHSFFSTAKAGRPAVWIGADNYTAMAADPVFWQSLRNNLVFALGTIPTSMALALAMALLVDERLRGRAALRLA